MFQRCKRCDMYIGTYAYWVDGQTRVKYLCPSCDRREIWRLSEFRYITQEGVKGEQKSKK